MKHTNQKLVFKKDHSANVHLQSTYWCGTKPSDDVPEDKRISIGQIPEYFETEPEGLRAGIQIRNLRKVTKNTASKRKGKFDCIFCLK